MPGPSSSTAITQSSPCASPLTCTDPPPSVRSTPCCTAFSTSGCSARNGIATGQHLRRDAHLHPQPLAQHRAGERQVGLDGAELARQRRVLAVPGEVVPDVEGEVEQQLAGAAGRSARTTRSW
jgi:hypothetical protein